MKPAKFDYVLAGSVEQAVDVLGQGDGEAIVIAGGQTLMPLLSMRLARPATVVDINKLAELSGIEVTPDAVAIKTCTRQATALSSALVQEKLPLLAKAISYVGHQQTRNRGTVGGSLCHADPASEIPLAALTMDAEIELRSASGTRWVAASDYFLGPMMTERGEQELLVSVRFPLPVEGIKVGTGFHEVSERKGDFAVVAAAAQIQDIDGVCQTAALALGGVDGTPIRIAAAEAHLLGGRIDEKAIQAALSEIDGAISPSDDQHVTAAYRRRVAKKLSERALRDAVAEAMR